MPPGPVGVLHPLCDTAGALNRPVPRGRLLCENGGGLHHGVAPGVSVHAVAVVFSPHVIPAKHTIIPSCFWSLFPCFLIAVSSIHDTLHSVVTVLPWRYTNHMPGHHH